jgi:membrane protein CcdC involved in cytochrome C biogenesis
MLKIFSFALIIKQLKMNNFFYAIGAFFESIFEFMPAFGNALNYFFMLVIFIFLIVWTSKMVKHKKNGEEHSSS